MEELIEGLMILHWYAQPGTCAYPAHDVYTGEDVLCVEVDPTVVTPENLTRLAKLHFIQDGHTFSWPGVH
jgi:hypothetical protein